MDLQRKHIHANIYIICISYLFNVNIWFDYYGRFISSCAVSIEDPPLAEHRACSGGVSLLYYCDIISDLMSTKYIPCRGG